MYLPEGIVVKILCLEARFFEPSLSAVAPPLSSQRFNNPKVHTYHTKKRSSNMASQSQIMYNVANRFPNCFRTGDIYCRSASILERTGGVACSISAARFSRLGGMVLAASDEVAFLRPVQLGDTVVVGSEVTGSWRHSLEVALSVEREPAGPQSSRTSDNSVSMHYPSRYEQKRAMCMLRTPPRK